MDALSEFVLIDRFFKQQWVARSDVLLGVGDDAAVVTVPAGQQLVVTMDTLVAGVHFLESWDPYDIGYKALAVNLSDLAAMAAEPAWATLSLSLPEANAQWLEKFCQGFYQLAKQYQVQLIGGDITRGPLVITLELHGFVPLGQAVTRAGAKIGDLIYVTGHLGEAGLALQMERQQIKRDEAVLKALRNPQPRIREGMALRNIAHSMIDISDGLAADLGHMLQQSQVGALLYQSQLPIAPSLQRYLTVTKAWELALFNGDDYELCFTIAKQQQQQLEHVFEQFDCKAHHIGVIEEGQSLRYQSENGQIMGLEMKGHQHF